MSAPKAICPGCRELKSECGCRVEDGSIDMNSCTKWWRDDGNLYFCHRPSGHAGDHSPHPDAAPEVSAEPA